MPIQPSPSQGFNIYLRRKEAMKCPDQSTFPEVVTPLFKYHSTINVLIDHFL